MEGVVERGFFYTEDGSWILMFFGEKDLDQLVGWAILVFMSVEDIQKPMYLKLTSFTNAFTSPASRKEAFAYLITDTE